MAIDRKVVEGYISDAMSDFFYYDRKGDEDFTIEDAENLIPDVFPTKEALAQAFYDAIINTTL